MRDIKFRVFNTKELVMSAPFTLEDFAYDQDVENGLGDFSLAWYDWKRSPPMVDNILMQYTGLKDKNGKEIYEGDIVTFEGHIGQIQYYTANVGGGEFRIEPNGERHFYDEMGVKFVWNEIEIIGNIYSNPELINNQKEK